MTYRHDARCDRWYLPAVIALVTFSAYIPALQFGFVWDDESAFIENPHYRGIGWAQLKWMWTTFYLGAYRPLTWMTHSVDDLLWGWRPDRYHLINVVLHAANAVVVYFVARRLLSLVRRPQEYEALGLNICAAATALLFAIHPLRVEPVVWVSGRADVLAGLFLLLSVLAYLKYGAGFAAAGLYLLSLLAKPVGLSFPMVLLVLDMYPLRRLKGSSIGAAFGLLREKILFFALAAAALCLAFLSKVADTSIATGYGPIGRVFLMAHAIAFYVWKTLVPVGLSPLYERPYQIDPLAPPFLLGIVAVLVLTSFAILGRNRWPAVLAAWVCYVALILPTSGVVQFGWQMAADRYTYMACVPWALLAGGGLWRVWSVRRPGAVTWKRLVPVGLVAVLLASLGLLTWRQVDVWRSDETLWVRALSVNPRSAVAHHNIARLLFRQGLLVEATAHIETALDLQPSYAEAHNSLGLLLVRQGRIGEAIQSFRKALELSPSYDAARVNLKDVLGERVR